MAAGPQDEGGEIGEFIIRGFLGIVHRPVFSDSREQNVSKTIFLFPSLDECKTSTKYSPS